MPNRLQHETSPYLLQHKDNPVDWYPWGEEAFAKARSLDQPILLSVGYSACHWCHVMERESFEDEATARRMNEGFVCIKVDREERPNVDQLYQGVIQLMRRGGGWPLTVFLTPQLKPFFGGTYFPPTGRFGMPSFSQVLDSVAQAFGERRAQIERSATELTAGLSDLLRVGLEAEPSPVEAENLAQVGEALAAQIDPRLGGFAGTPKFPHPDVLEALLRAGARGAAPAVRDRALLTLDRMAEGGLFDQLGGGFHRYSTDATWSVPHFEKMLYDNALLLHAYAEAFQLTGRPLYARAAEGVVGWLEREMRSPEGGFYSSQDADSDGEEGRYFAFTPEQFEAALGKELGPLLCEHFGVDAEGNFEGGRTVLSIARDALALSREHGLPLPEVESRLAEGRRRLLAARCLRTPPARDDKILAGWNGLAVRGLSRAGRAMGRPEWTALARGAADFCLSSLREGPRLLRSFRAGRAHLEALLEDYGDLADGLVELFMASFDARYLEAAIALADQALAAFWDEPSEAFLASPAGGERLLAPVFALHDDAWPSGASSLCHALVQLSGLVGRPDYLERAGRYLARMKPSMVQNPFGFGRLWCAADTFLGGAATLLVRGSPTASAALIGEASRRYAPALAVAWSGEAQPPGSLSAVFEGKPLPSEGAAAYLCRGFTCELPASGTEVLDKVAAPAANR
jgi:hypothetical protein